MINFVVSNSPTKASLTKFIEMTDVLLVCIEKQSSLNIFKYRNHNRQSS